MSELTQRSSSTDRPEPRSPAATALNVTSPSSSSSSSPPKMASSRALVPLHTRPFAASLARVRACAFDAHTVALVHSVDFARSPFASPTAYLSVRQVNMSDPRPLPSGRISRLASKVDTLSLVESHNARLPRPPPPPPPSTSPFPQISLDDANLPKSFNCLCPLSTPQGADTDAPWYRFCRPAAPVPLACDGFEAASPLTAVLPTDVTPGAQLDQENLSPSHAPSSLGSPPSPTYGQPLTTVSNILQSPIMFGGRPPGCEVNWNQESAAALVGRPRVNGSCDARLSRVCGDTRALRAHAPSPLRRHRLCHYVQGFLRIAAALPTPLGGFKADAYTRISQMEARRGILSGPGGRPCLVVLLHAARWHLATRRVRSRRMTCLGGVSARTHASPGCPGVACTLACLCRALAPVCVHACVHACVHVHITWARLRPRVAFSGVLLAKLINQSRSLDSHMRAWAEGCFKLNSAPPSGYEEGAVAIVASKHAHVSHIRSGDSGCTWHSSKFLVGCQPMLCGSDACAVDHLVQKESCFNSFVPYSALLRPYPQCAVLTLTERLPKWSVLRRPESNPMPTRPSSVDSLNHPSASQLEGDQNINSSRDSPHTPLVSAFDRRRSCFTSLAAPGLTRPTVLKRGPAMSVDVVATRASDFHATKRSATSNRSISEGCSVKKIRMYSLVPSENSAFLPVGHRGSLPKSSEVSPTDPGTPTLPPSFV
ncbi:unnamed protein product [Mesocestoides corti]|uniref:Uncharacterized protein n=1 Tax=Mesocestoides corti TaxID=53468 RepID=A0A158QUI5_MESCO|nr:unnamed protein product [Mesocestoides corti]